MIGNNGAATVGGVGKMATNLYDVQWSAAEQSVLEEGLRLYTAEQYTSLWRYIKIAANLPYKGVRDVALRVRWMSRRDAGGGGGGGRDAQGLHSGPTVRGGGDGGGGGGKNKRKASAAARTGGAAGAHVALRAHGTTAGEEGGVAVGGLGRRVKGPKTKIEINDDYRGSPGDVNVGFNDHALRHAHRSAHAGYGLGESAQGGVGGLQATQQQHMHPPPQHQYQHQTMGGLGPGMQHAAAGVVGQHNHHHQHQQPNGGDALSGGHGHAASLGHPMRSEGGGGHHHLSSSFGSHGHPQQPHHVVGPGGGVIVHDGAMGVSHGHLMSASHNRPAGLRGSMAASGARPVHEAQGGMVLMAMGNHGQGDLRGSVHLPAGAAMHQGPGVQGMMPPQPHGNHLDAHGPSQGMRMTHGGQGMMMPHGGQGMMMSASAADGSGIAMAPLVQSMYVPTLEEHGESFLHAAEAVDSMAGVMLNANVPLIGEIQENMFNGRVGNNVELLSQLRDNIMSIIDDMNATPGMMNQMPQLPVQLDFNLANALLPPRRMRSVSTVNAFHTHDRR